MTSREYPRVSVVPAVVVTAGPLLAMLLWRLSASLLPQVPAEAAYLTRLEVMLSVFLAGTAISLVWSARRVTGSLTRFELLTSLVSCTFAAALASTPGACFSSLVSAFGAVFATASVTGVAMLLYRKDGKHAIFAFSSVLFSSATFAAWHVAVPPIVAAFMINP